MAACAAGGDRVVLKDGLVFSGELELKDERIEVTERQHNTNAELQQMIVTIETATDAARDALDSLDGMFGQTATVAHQTRLISTDMRKRTEALQHECERIVAMLRNSDRAGARGDLALPA